MMHRAGAYAHEILTLPLFLQVNSGPPAVRVSRSLTRCVLKVPPPHDVIKFGRAAETGGLGAFDGF
jgi:hypothetical protein